MFRTKVTINDKALRAALLKDVSRKRVEVAQAVIADLKVATPKDTGEAAESWSVNYGTIPDQFYLVNKAEHIRFLNAGHSPQAPAYFIESVVLRYGTANGRVVEEAD